MILVVGSTGFLGGEICRRLTLGGKSVRGLVRSSSDPQVTARLKSMGVETVIGDLREPATLRSACQGVDAVITTATTTRSMQPGDSIPVTDQQGQLDLIEAACAANVKQFILVSVPSNLSDCPLSTAKRTVEKALIASGMSYTILQPGIFMEVWLSPMLGFDYPNTRATIFGDGLAKNTFISLGDVAQAVVESLDHPAARNRALELGYSQNYSLMEVVRIFEKISGKSFEVQFIPEAALKAQRSAAADPLQVSISTMMLDIASGCELHPNSASNLINFPLLSVEEYARQVLR